MSRPIFTQAIIDAHQIKNGFKRVGRISNEGKPAGFVEVEIKKRVRQDSKPLMNKLEAEFYQTIRWDDDICDLNIQAVRFRLGNGIWYKPDFTAYHSKTDRQTAWEVKGPHIFRGGIENLKVAASLRKDMDWILVWKESGVWQTQRINP